MYHGIVWRAVYYSIVCPGGGLALFSLEGVWGAVGCGGRGASWTCGVLLCSQVQSSAVQCSVVQRSHCTAWHCAAHTILLWAILLLLLWGGLMH